MFNEAMGVEPTRINSSLVSAQNRDRYYWHNFGEIPQPEDKGLLLRDIIEDNNYSEKIEQEWKPEFKKNYIQYDISGKGHNSQDQRAFYDDGKHGALPSHGGESKVKVTTRPCELKDFNENSTCHHAADATDIKGNESVKRVYAESGKSPAMTTCQGGHREPKVLQSETTYRKLTPLECERLQTLGDNYTLVLGENNKQIVSNSQRYKMIGNGWTVDVIAHIFKGLNRKGK